MRRKVEEHVGAAGATAVALVFVVAYSFWGASILSSQHASAAEAPQQQLAVK